MLKVLRQVRSLYIIMWGIILYIPLIILIVFSFNDSRYIVRWKGFTLDGYLTLWGQSREMESVLNSLYLSALAVVLTIPISYFLGLYIRFQNKAIRSYLSIMLYVQVLIPEVVMGISLAQFFTLFQVDLGLTTMVIGHVTFSIGFFVLTFVSQLHSDLWRFRMVSIDLGETIIRSLINIVAPLTIRPLIASTFLILALSLDNYVISFFTTGPGASTLPIMLFSSVRHGIDPRSNAAATILLIAVSLLLILTAKIVVTPRLHQNSLKERLK